MYGTIGLSWAEVVGLLAQNLDLESGKLMITTTLSEVNCYFHESSPISVQTRVFSIPSIMIPMLKELVNGARGTDLAFGNKKTLLSNTQTSSEVSLKLQTR